MCFSNVWSIDQGLKCPEQNFAKLSQIILILFNAGHPIDLWLHESLDPIDVLLDPAITSRDALDTLFLYHEALYLGEGD